MIVSITIVITRTSNAAAQSPLILSQQQRASLDTMAAESLRRWGHPYPMAFEFGTLGDQYPAGTVAAAAPIPAHPAVLCRVWVSLRPLDALFALPPELQQAYVDHEVGHCLGLPHPDDPPDVLSLMAGHYLVGITALDVARYRALWPTVRPYQATVPALAHD